MASVLIVEDRADTGEALKGYLEDFGHKVTCVENGREALTMVLQNVPDVVVLDLLTPEMDGPSFLEVVRSYLRLQSLPVVVHTGLGDSPLVDRARALKVNAILMKGKASLEEIKHAVEEAAVRIPT